MQEQDVASGSDPAAPLGAAPSLSALDRIIADRAIVPYYQPIVDLYFGEVYSFEVLSRAPSPFANADLLFAWAQEYGRLWRLESICREAALRSIAELPPKAKGKRFFFNVSPGTFCDPRFADEFPPSKLRQLGIDLRQIVLEVTESSHIADYDRFEGIIRRQVDKGYQIALDDFGAGHSSLITLMAASPHFVKLDRAIVAGIHKDSYKQQLVRSIASFLASVESQLVAEGVEELAEVETLLRLGVRYAQGFLLARPSAEPPQPDAGVLSAVRRITRRLHYPRVSLSTDIMGMVVRPPVFEPGTTTCDQLDDFFRHTPSADHVVVLEGGKPAGLIPRRHFYTLASGRYGFQLIQKKLIETVAKREPLRIEEGMDLRVLGRLAMEREADDVYDPVIVVEPQGGFIGTITLKELVSHATRLEVEMAASANPLTGLPGNTLIQSWLQEALEAESYWVIYGDLDRFKEYNDSYGFPQGDRMIKTAAAVLSEYAPKLCGDARLGHLGGDDFIMVGLGPLEAGELKHLCAEFDRRRLPLFRAEDAERGFYRAKTRTGETMDVHLVTLSLAVIASGQISSQPAPGQFGQIAASLKSKIKAINAAAGCSGFLMERRQP